MNEGSIRKTEVDLIVSNGVVFTMDENDNHYAIGSIIVDKGRVVEVGPSAELEERYIGKEYLDAQRHMILPGMIDSHIHLGLHLGYFRPTANFNDSILANAEYISKEPPGWAQRDADYIRTLPVMYGSMNVAVDDELAELTAKHAAILAIRSGVTLSIDGAGGQPKQYARGFVDSGVRLALSDLSADVMPQNDGRPRKIGDPQNVLKHSLSTLEFCHAAETELLTYSFSLFSDITSSDALIRDMFSAALENDLLVSVHMAAQSQHDSISEQVFGARGVARMDGLGVIGPNLLGVHAGFLEQSECNVLAERGAHISHNPTAAAFYGKGLLHDGGIYRLALAGVNMALGTDDTWNGSLLCAAKSAFAVHKDVAGDTRVMPYYKIAKMLFSGAAKAIRRPDLGQLSAGRHADFIIVDTDHPRYIDPEGPLQVFIKRGEISDIEATVVAGQFLMKDKQLTNLDEKDVCARLRLALKEYWQKRK